LDRGIDVAIPKKIYKYFHFKEDERGIVNSLNSLAGGYVYAASPKFFNDPFDCAVQPDLKLTPDSLRRFLQSKGVGRNEINDAIEATFDADGVLTVAGEISQKDLQRQVVVSNHKLGVSCFSKTPYNPVMWAHYSNNHDGFCLEFDCVEPFKTVDGLDESVHLFRAVTYAKSDYLPSVTMDDFLRNDQKILDLISQKGKRWQYEEECRLIVNIKRDSDRQVSFESSHITGVFYGINIASIMKAQVGNIVSEKYPHAIQYNMKVSEKHYWMDREPLTENGAL
jgi:hypothetical protein